MQTGVRIGYMIFLQVGAMDLTNGLCERAFKLFGALPSWRADGRYTEDSYIPDLIKGDFDSLRDDVRAYYENLVSLFFTRG